MQGSIPHSGNFCSGLCTTPCDHNDCWQCVDLHERNAIKRTQTGIQKLQEMVADHQKKEVKPKGLLSGLPAQRPEDHQKATITRAALEGLVEKAGLSMDWNNGDPVIRDGIDPWVTRSARQSVTIEMERKRRAELERKVMELEEAKAKYESKMLSEQAAQILGGYSNTVSKAINDKIASTLRGGSIYDYNKSQLKATEDAAIAQLKEDGATDADIKAAEKLFGWKAPDSEFARQMSPTPVPDWVPGVYGAAIENTYQRASRDTVLSPEDIQKWLVSTQALNDSDHYHS